MEQVTPTPVGVAVIVARHDSESVEYAIGTVAAAAFGALLYTVVTGDSILTALTGLVERALTVTF
ncbi:hypothetical protein BJF90_26395 [Pseudonocardia sp. CNS-004]|nr:hypothetical protein BJF90_26395 [Pseudonocardia sp. CNS-004]